MNSFQYRSTIYTCLKNQGLDPTKAMMIAIKIAKYTYSDNISEVSFKQLSQIMLALQQVKIAINK